MPKYSVIVPVYNRPDELKELLGSLRRQSFTDFEVVVIDDGSTITSELIVRLFTDEMDIRYIHQENTGQGFARNTGFKVAVGDYFLVFDSDCILPTGYFEALNEFLEKHNVDAFGGPDASHPSFNIIQKAISQSMTAFLTTGGIRGRKQHVGKYHPRSFNMGFRKAVYEKIGGYKIPFMGEDMEFSSRIIREGYTTNLIPEAFVYHKRRTDFWKFAKQLWYFGRARINLSRFYPDEVKIIHLFPTVFLVGILSGLMAIFISLPVAYLFLVAYSLYFILLFFESLFSTRSMAISVLVPFAGLIQLTAYGYGFLYEWVRKLFGVNPNTKYTELY